MIIGIDGRRPSEFKTGISYYLENLLRELTKLDSENTYKLLGLKTGLKSKNLKVYSLSRRKGRLIGFLWKTIGWPRFEKLIKGCDLGFFPNFVIPPTKITKKILTIPDLAFVYYPGFIEQKNLKYLERFVKGSAEKASKIITISDHTKNDIIKHFGIPPLKIITTHLAAAPDFKPVEKEKSKKLVTQKYKIKKDYLLFVGTLEPRKNIETLIKAFSRLMLIRKKYQLVICGSRGWYWEGIFKLIRKNYLTGDVKVLGYVSQKDLPLLYSAADLFAFPSFYEGFGLPVLEAMSCGTPVVCSNTSSLPEIAGEAAIYFNPFDTSELAARISEVLTNEPLRQKLIAAGLEQAKKFSWEKTAQKTLAVIKRVYSGD